MDIQIDHYNEIVVARLIGELNQRTSQLIQERVVPLIKPNCRIVLDMEQLSYLSSAGLRILLLLYRQISNNEGRVALANLQEMVKDTMSITGFLSFFDAYESRQEAVQALQETRVAHD